MRTVGVCVVSSFEDGASESDERVTQPLARSEEETRQVVAGKVEIAWRASRQAPGEHSGARVTQRCRSFLSHAKVPVGGRGGIAMRHRGAHLAHRLAGWPLSAPHTCTEDSSFLFQRHVIRIRLVVASKTKTLLRNCGSVGRGAGARPLRPC